MTEAGKRSIWGICLEKNTDGTRTVEARLALRMLRRRSPEEVSEHFGIPTRTKESLSEEVRR
jgi:hypothetical protein